MRYWTYRWWGTNTWSMSNFPSTSRPTQAWRTLRGTLRDQRSLARELASYRTTADVDDLLAALDRDDSQQAEQIRTILTQNLQDRRGRHQFAS
jgi:hypothetical protein